MTRRGCRRRARHTTGLAAGWSWVGQGAQGFSSTHHTAHMPLYIIGLGLGDESDITLKGADAIKKCDKVFLESYTSILAVPAERLEALYGKKVEIAFRETVESEAEKILEPAKTGNVAFLVVGDPFGYVGAVFLCSQLLHLLRRHRLSLFLPTSGELLQRLFLPFRPIAYKCRATTHTDILIRAQDMGIETHVVHNASIMNAAGCSGLQLYSFGATISIPYFTETWRPDSFYDKIAYNAGGGMHTLCLLGEGESCLHRLYRKHNGCAALDRQTDRQAES